MGSRKMVLINLSAGQQWRCRLENRLVDTGRGDGIQGLLKSEKCRRPKQTFLQRRHTDGQKAHEKMLNITNYWASLVTQMVKNLPAMQETLVQSLSWEDPLEKGILIHNILKLKIAIFSKTKKNQKVALFGSFHIFLMLGLIEGVWILICFCIQSVVIYVMEPSGNSTTCTLMRVKKTSKVSVLLWK